MFENSSFLITGGTGSFGNTMLERLLKTEVSRIVCFSRDESKQYLMQQSITDSRVNFVIGDIRNFDSIGGQCIAVSNYGNKSLSVVDLTQKIRWQKIIKSIK